MRDDSLAARRAAPAAAAGRLDWLDLLRTLAILEIIGFHWLRTSQENGAFGLVYAQGYENVGIGFHQLFYLLTDKSGQWPGAIVNNVIGVAFGYGWEAVNVFVLLSGLGLALSYQPDRPGFSLGRWYLRRYQRILLPYYVIALPLILVAEVLKAVGTGQPGLLGAMAMKLTVKNLPDPLGIELAKHLFLVDPRQPFWITDFFSPAWWFLPPILVAYLVFPLLWRGLDRLGRGVMLALALLATAAGYLLTSGGVLPEHGPYFVVLHEAFNFVLGIAIGRTLTSAAARERARTLLARPRSLLLGAVLFAIGNVANWFHLSHPVCTAIFTFGFTLILGFVAAWLARIPAVLALSRRTDGYHIYLLHQWLAFPLVLLTVAAFGAAAPRYGFSLGFLAYVVLAVLVVLVFERLWRPLEARLGRPAAVAVAPKAAAPQA